MRETIVMRVLPDFEIRLSKDVGGAELYNVYDRTLNRIIGHSKRYETALTFALTRQEPITVGTPPDGFHREQLCTYGPYTVVRTVRMDGENNLRWVYEAIGRDGSVVATSSSFIDISQRAVRLAAGARR